MSPHISQSTLLAKAERRKAVITHGGFLYDQKGVMPVQGVLTWLADCVPTGTEVETGSMTAVAGGLIAYLCGWDKAMEALLVLMGIDYVTGMLAAKVNPNLGGWSSKVGFRGICKKVLILSIVALAHFISDLTGGEAARVLVIWFFIGNEGLSIVENAANSGVPVPKKLRDTLEQLKNEKDEKKGEQK